MTQRS